MIISLPRLLNSSHEETKRIRPVRVSISQNIIPLSTATVTLLQEDEIPDRTFVELFTLNGSAGVFRSKPSNKTYGNPSNTVSLEHALCELGDYIVKEKLDQTQTDLATAMARVFGHYGGSHWQLGMVLSDNSLIYSLNYGDNVLTTINNLITKVPGIMISCDFSTNPWTLSVVDRGTEVTAEGRLSRNISSVSITKNDTNLCTRVWMENLGTGGAIDYLDSDNRSLYGIVERKIDGSGYTQAQAIAAAQKYLDANDRPKYSISIAGYDFHDITGETLDQVAIGKLYRLAIPEDSLTIEEHIIKLDWGDVYGTPENVTITLAEEEETLVGVLKATESKTDTAVEKAQESANSAYSYADSVNGSVSTLSQTVTSNDGRYWSKFEQTDRAIAAEVARATNAEGTKIAKTQDIQTVTDLLGSAAQTAQGYATSAKEACIAKTQVYQTADAIVTSAVAYSGADAATKYIAMTNTYQTADAIVNEAVRVSGVNATNDFIKKSGNYTTVDSLITKAQQDAEAAATTAAAGCIAKTSTYQSASAIVNSAVATASYNASQTYIAKTTTYQTADAIVSTAEAYTDGKIATQSSTIEQLSDKISLVVTRVGNQDEIDVASIVAAVNDAGSAIQISADHIDLQGHVSVTDLTEYGATAPGRLDVDMLKVTEELDCDIGYFSGLVVDGTQFEPTTVTINGVQYRILAE